MLARPFSLRCCLLLVLVLGEQGVEADVLEDQLREAALGHQVLNDLARIGEQEVRAIGAEHGAQLLF